MARLFSATLVLLSASLLWLGCESSRSCSNDEDCFSGEECFDGVCIPSEEVTADAGGNDDGGTESDSDVAEDTATDDADATSSDPRITKIEAGETIACALFDDGAVYCWGRNENGLLSIDSTLDETPYPTRVEGIPSADDLELGHNFACIRSDAGDIYCWGENWGFDSSKDDRDIIEPSAGPVSGIALLRTGAVGGCGMLDDKRTLTCWGNAPSPPEFSQDIKDLQIGSYHACAVLDDGDVRCWGTTSPQAGEDDPIRGISEVVALDAAREYNCAVKGDGTVWCWGSNFYGQLGADPDVQGSTPTPIQVPGIESAVGISTGYKWACAIIEGGSVKCWGTFREDNGDYEDFHALMTVDPLVTDVVDVDTGEETTCALQSSGDAWCWGDNTDEQLGNSELNSSGGFEPTRVVFE